MKKLTKPFEDLMKTGWRCMACRTWNANNRKACWYCSSPPETRAKPDQELGGEG